MKITSILLFTGIISMILIFAGQVSYKHYSGTTPSTSKEVYTKGSVMDSVAIIMTAYAFIINFFPIFSSMEVRTNTNGFKAVGLALTFCFLGYSVFTFLALDLYGTSVNPDLFVNIKA